MISAAQFRSRLDGIRRRVRVRDEAHGVTYDSRIEAKRGGQLHLLQSFGRIRHLRVHPRFDLIVNGVKVATYVADFDYYEGETYVVEDVKPASKRNDPVYRIKRKLMLACLKINVTEVNL